MVLTDQANIAAAAKKEPKDFWGRPLSEVFKRKGDPEAENAALLGGASPLEVVKWQKQLEQRTAEAA